MKRRIAIRAPVGKGFWDPWSVEEIARAPQPKKTEFRKVCVICFSEIAEGAPTIQCPHCGAIGHQSCFEDWLSLRGTCPLCRRPITL